MTNAHHLARIEQCKVIIDRIIAQTALLEVEIGRLRAACTERGFNTDNPPINYEKAYGKSYQPTSGRFGCVLMDVKGNIFGDNHKRYIDPPDTVQSVDEIVTPADEPWQIEDVVPDTGVCPVCRCTVSPTCPDCGNDRAIFEDGGWYCFTCRVAVEEDVQPDKAELETCPYCDTQLIKINGIWHCPKEDELWQTEGE